MRRGKAHRWVVEGCPTLGGGVERLRDALGSRLRTIRRTDLRSGKTVDRERAAATPVASHAGNILPPLLRLVFALGIYCLPSCDWFSR
eukprot:48597-Prorocentrum_minimum.AAC.1